MFFFKRMSYRESLWRYFNNFTRDGVYWLCMVEVTNIVWLTFNFILDNKNLKTYVLICFVKMARNYSFIKNK